MLEQSTMQELAETLKKRGKNSDSVGRFMAYLDSINKMNKGKDGTFNMTDDDFYRLFIKYDNVGITLDGVNAVLSGFNRVFITWVGYKNKVLSVYPESEFDVQLVKSGDLFQVSKESGAVKYTHDINDPFSSNKGIIGAYCVIKNKRGEALETLGSDDFNKMKSSAMMSSTWDKWESEFWLKSVIKRACKRHFNDIVAEVEKVDNEDYSLEKEKATDDQKQAILEAHGHSS